MGLVFISMTDYQSALNTSLGDYLSHRASQEGTTREGLEKKLVIEAIRVQGTSFLVGDSSRYAIYEFNKVAEGYDAVVELREGLCDVGLSAIFFPSYRISATGIKKK